jgi:hypothetical protein
LINSRTKGRAGEQEVARILRDELGLEVHRNWLFQAAEGGADLVGVPGWSIEIKRQKQLLLGDWWSQTVRQAERSGDKPILIYRLDRHPWRARCRACDMSVCDHRFVVEMDLADWCTVVREELNDQEH